MLSMNRKPQNVGIAGLEPRQQPSPLFSLAARSDDHGVILAAQSIAVLMAAASAPGWCGSRQPGRGGVACLPDSRAVDGCGWFFTEGACGCDLPGPVLEFPVWLMELALGVSAVLLEWCFGGAVLWFVVGARLWMCGLVIVGDVFSRGQGDP
jgi:hypothetical protein